MKLNALFELRYLRNSQITVYTTNLRVKGKLIGICPDIRAILIKPQNDELMMLDIKSITAIQSENLREEVV